MSRFSNINSVSDHEVEYGMQCLNDAELLSLATGIPFRVSAKIIDQTEYGIHSLKKMSLDELKSMEHIGRARAIRIKTSFDLALRVDSRSGEVERVTCSKDIFDLIKPYLSNKNHEQFYVIPLSRGNKVLDVKLMSTGGTAGTIVDPKMVFKYLLLKSASGFLVAHNHPSGNLKPSSQDLSITKRLKSIGKEMDLDLLDHLIIGDNAFFSFADEGYL